MSATSPRFPWYARLVFQDPAQVHDNLVRARDAGLVDEVPTLWQVTLGIARMLHRLVFRSDTVGLSQAHGPRAGWRARLFRFRPLRFPALLAEGSVTPLDLSGLRSGPERIIRHLIGAHHDRRQFVYDLQLLMGHPGQLEALRDEVRGVVRSDDARSRWLRDLAVYERYHEALLAAVERALDGDLGLTPDEEADPDIALSAYLRWCLAQPATPAASWDAWRRGGRTGVALEPVRHSECQA